jgi:hypothetical protein
MTSQSLVSGFVAKPVSSFLLRTTLPSSTCSRCLQSWRPAAVRTAWLSVLVLIACRTYPCEQVWNTLAPFVGPDVVHAARGLCLTADEMAAVFDMPFDKMAAVSCACLVHKLVSTVMDVPTRSAEEG